MTDRKQATSVNYRATLRSDGIVELRRHGDWNGVETLEHAKANMEIVEAVSDGQLRPVLCVVGPGQMSREARVFYSRSTAALAAAVIARTPVERMVVNFLAKFNKLRVPVRMFDDEASAVEWLEQYLPSRNEPHK